VCNSSYYCGLCESRVKLFSLDIFVSLVAIAFSVFFFMLLNVKIFKNNIKS